MIIIKMELVSRQAKIAELTKLAERMKQEGKPIAAELARLRVEQLKRQRQ